MKKSPDRFLSQRVKAIPPSGIRRFFDLVANTKGVISLGVGEPDFVTPWHVRAASIKSIELGYTTYTSNYGLPELRNEIAKYMLEHFNVSYDNLNEVLVTIGASEAVDVALRAVVEHGDEVLIPEPSYVSYGPCTTLAGGIPIGVPTHPDNGFKLSAQELEKKISSRSKVLLMSYPNNPTGGIMNRPDLEEVAKIVEKYDLMVIADEIYAELTYNAQHTSFPSLPGMKERTVLVNGFSKAFAMTGWRIGFSCAPQEITAAMLKIHQYAIMCAPIMGQMAALEALRDGRNDVNHMVEQYNQRRRLVVSRLWDIGLECFEPKGAFYVFPSVKITGMNGEEFAENLLAEENVAVVPGSAFGSFGMDHIRISYAASLEQLNEALNRMESFVSRHRKKIVNVAGI